MNPLLIAKINLYRLLINLDPADMSDSEVNVMYELSKDRDIQEILRNSK